MATYDTYKDSGVKWLGKIPSHWKIDKMRKFFSERKQLSSDGSEMLLSVSEYSGITPSTNDVGENISRSSSLVGYKKCKTSDLVINIMLAWKRGLGISDYEGIVSPAYCVFRTQNINPHYANYLLRTDLYTAEFKQNSTGIIESRLRMYPDDFKNIAFIMPPEAEQEGIVAYLDKVTGDIDRAIEAQQKMIDALNERKQIIITRAVTRGINPDAPLRDSGIDWLGKIPSHWKVTKVKYITYNLDRLRKPITADQRSRNNPKYDYYGASGAIDKIDYYCVEDRVLLIGEDGANLLMRNLPLIYKANGRFWVNNHAHILKEKPGYDYDYLAFLLEAGDYTNFITGSAQPKLTKANLGAYPIAIPPYNEQIEIVDYINQTISPIDNSLDKIKSMITLLQERKRIIINEVVTGKKKVI